MTAGNKMILESTTCLRFTHLHGMMIFGGYLGKADSSDSGKPEGLETLWERPALRGSPQGPLGFGEVAAVLSPGPAAVLRCGALC